MGDVIELQMGAKLQVVSRLYLRLLAVFAIASLAGCGPPNPANQIAAMNDSNIRRVANLYTAFQTRNNFRGPKDNAEFRDFITNKMLPQKLKVMGVDPADLESLFKSESSGKEFEIIYGLQGSLGSEMAAVFDGPNGDGSRIVAFTNGPAETIDEQQYKQLKENPLRESGSTQAGSANTSTP